MISPDEKLSISKQFEILDISRSAVYIKPNNGRWKNHEYLQQYPWISYDQARHLFMVTTPEGKRLTLFNWLS